MSQPLILRDNNLDCGRTSGPITCHCCLESKRGTIQRVKDWEIIMNS
jgi:hypothetical protein